MHPHDFVLAAACTLVPATGAAQLVIEDTLFSPDIALYEHFGIEVAADGNVLTAFASGEIVQCNLSGVACTPRLYAFDATTRELLYTLTSPEVSFAAGSEVDEHVELAEGRLLIGNSGDVYDAASGQLLYPWNNPQVSAIGPCSVSADWAAFSYEHDSFSASIDVVDLTTSAAAYTIDFPGQLGVVTFEVRALDLDGDQALLAVERNDSSPGTVLELEWLDVPTGARTPFPTPADWRDVRHVQLEGAWLIVFVRYDTGLGFFSFELSIWDRATEQEIGTIELQSPTGGSAFIRSFDLEEDRLGVEGSIDNMTRYLVYDLPSLTPVAQLAPAFQSAFDLFGIRERIAISAGRIVLADPGNSQKSDLLDPQTGGPTVEHGAVRIYSTETFATYCTAKTNSQGCEPRISAQGVASFDPTAGFDVTASEIVSGKVGLLAYTICGRAAIPFLGGTLCLTSPLVRTPLQGAGGTGGAVDCSGTFAFDINALIQGGTDPWLTAGTEVDAQFWYRDPEHPDGTGGGLSDALEFTIQL